MSKQKISREMRVAPKLDFSKTVGPVCRQHALLINPFYAKDPNSSLGKHVLTPTMALISVAANTPGHWTVDY
ncbi:hypothetical protein Q31b_45330 [Novipirellula aureliae]|uniref:Uncharacterized protein n=1 Tax=Novipirellula aureliae TaxID=2527966 RepID=A0A5C6DNH6_9BACT|nr:hypothetical protein [Novipirellula aureliae]TWU37744.1 hypothetical protein Q31b_45330 [Novipirellula aureliae]